MVSFSDMPLELVGCILRELSAVDVLNLCQIDELSHWYRDRVVVLTDVDDGSRSEAYGSLKQYHPTKLKRLDIFQFMVVVAESVEEDHGFWRSSPTTAEMPKNTDTIFKLNLAATSYRDDYLSGYFARLPVFPSSRASFHSDTLVSLTLNSATLTPHELDLPALRSLRLVNCEVVGHERLELGPKMHNLALEGDCRSIHDRLDFNSTYIKTLSYTGFRESMGFNNIINSSIESLTMQCEIAALKDPLHFIDVQFLGLKTLATDAIGKCSNLTMPILEQCAFYVPHLLQENYFSINGLHAPLLKDLTIDSPVLRELRAVEMPNLRNVVMKSQYMHDDSTPGDINTSFLSVVKKYNASGRFAGSFIPMCKAVTDLQIGSNVLNGDIHLGGSLKNLESLVIKGAAGVGGLDDVFARGVTLPNLREFDIMNCYSLTSLEFLQDYMPNLVTLDIDEAPLLDVIRGCSLPKLETLSIQVSEELTFEQCEFPNLQSLTLGGIDCLLSKSFSGVTSLSDFGIGHAHNKLKKLVIRDAAIKAGKSKSKTLKISDLPALESVEFSNVFDWKTKQPCAAEQSEGIEYINAAKGPCDGFF